MHYRSKNFQGDKCTNIRIGSSTFIDYPENLIIANNVYIGHHNFIEASNRIQIDEGCQITSFISITTHSSHNSIRLYGNQYSNVKNHIGYIKGAISIGKFCFVGPHVTIMPDTIIGEGCVVAAYSFVKGNFPPFSLISGNPAIVIGSTKDYDQKYLEKYPELQQYYMRSNENND